MAEIPLFPLPLVLFPGGRQRLNIFETRYLDMVRGCMREDDGFVLVMIRKGDQVMRTASASLPSICTIGTYVRIIDFDPSGSGMLGITVEGDVKVRVRTNRAQDDGLMLGEIETLPLEEDVPVPESFAHLAVLLEQFSEHEMVQRLNLSIDYESAAEVSARLTEFLPCPDPVKQFLFELGDPVERLTQLDEVIRQLQADE